MGQVLTLSEEEKAEIVNDLVTIRKEMRADDFMPAAEKYLSRVQLTDSKDLELDILFQLCLYHAHITTRFDNSNEYAFKCLALARELNKTAYEANCLRMIGVNYQFLGELEKARDAYDEAIRIIEPRPNLSNEEKEILGGVYFNSVGLYRESEMDPIRLGYIDKSNKLYKEIDNEIGIARTYIAYAEYYPGIAHTDRAVTYFEEAAKIFAKVHDYRSQGNCLSNIGYHYCLKGDFERGMPLVEEGIESIKKTGNNIFLVNAKFYLAICLRLQKKFDQAFEYYREAEGYMTNVHAKINLVDLYQEWSIGLEQSGQYKEALEMYKRYLEEKERMVRFDKKSAINEARMSFELEEKKKEAEFLKKKNAEIEEYTRKLEMTNFELKQFAHVASHDLKEPLRMVILYMQLLEKSGAGKLNIEEHQYLNFAREGAARMHELIKGLLAFSKISPCLHPQPVDLNKILGKVKESLAGEIEAKGLRVIAGELPVIKSNEENMLLLFQNLISNAVKFNQSTQPEVEISVQMNTRGYIFSFTDNGIGIEPEYRTRVFEIFQRLNGRDKYEGTGIGLSICKKIIEQMNGKIWIEEGKSGGSSVRFELAC